MTILENDPREQPTPPDGRPERRRYYVTGLVLIAAGALLIAKQMGNVFPDWLFSWELLLILIGIYVGEKHHFRGFGWLIPIAIGGISLLNNFYPDLSIHRFIWPAALMLLGLIFIIRPRKISRHRSEYSKRYFDEHSDRSFVNSSEDYMDSVSIFGSTKKNILSKNFRGGEATSIFGGTEINLSQADIQGVVELELTQVMGGCKLIIPPHWEIKTELVNIFGGMEDKRPVQNITIDPSKVIIIKGTSVFGGIEIRSY